MSSILTFSDQAKTRLKEIMSSDEYKNALGLRISVKSGGCAGMTYDMNYVEQLIDGDEKIEVEGVNVFIDPKAIMYLLGTEMVKFQQLGNADWLMSYQVKLFFHRF